MIEKYAYAKINLTLEIGKKRPDGYHDLTSIMARATLADKVTLSRNDIGCIRFSSTDKTIPQEDSLCAKAAKLYFDAKGISGEGVDIHLENNIPTASGMGGGSADAAATIECLELLFGELHADVRQKLAVSLGADVAFCFNKESRMCRGIGDEITELECASLDGLWLVISKVGEKLSTGKVYSDFDAFGSTLDSHNHEAVINALKAGDIKALAGSVFNDFESVVFASSPEVKEERERLISGGALGVVMSGAGPTLVAFFDDKEKAEQCGKVYKLIT